MTCSLGLFSWCRSLQSFKLGFNSTAAPSDDHWPGPADHPPVPEPPDTSRDLGALPPEAVLQADRFSSTGKVVNLFYSAQTFGCQLRLRNPLLEKALDGFDPSIPFTN